jgi:hypothetical protein
MVRRSFLQYHQYRNTGIEGLFLHVPSVQKHIQIANSNCSNIILYSWNEKIYEIKCLYIKITVIKLMQKKLMQKLFKDNYVSQKKVDAETYHVGRV